MSDPEQFPPDDGRFEGTIDWDAYWRDPPTDPDYPASVSANKADDLDRFFDIVGTPADAAFVGCGDGTLAARVATTDPGTDVVGYDAARTVVRRNRREYADVPNLSFETAALPWFDVDRRFDLVFSYATLHYVAAVEAAVEAMADRLRQGGHLVFTYPNEAFRAAHADAVGRTRERFEFVVEGRNVTSRAALADRLETAGRDFWALVDADGPYVRPENPCLVVER
jgi:SAM-dependent methyltransferase